MKHSGFPLCLGVCLTMICLTQSHGQDDQPRTDINGDFPPAGDGQLRTPPALFPAGVDEGGRAYFLNGQPAAGGKLIFTASNGFFDSGTCRASGESPRPKVGDDDLIKPNFAWLDQWNKTEGTLRWHVWLAKPGAVSLQVNMRVAPAAAGSRVVVSLGGQTRTVTTVASPASQPQPWDLTFDVKTAGEHTLALAAASIASLTSGVGELHTIDATGSAITDAQLLRARWRPAAVHGGYECSTLPESRLWVMSTRSTRPFSSYSPITTPFGYFGTSFAADGRVKGSFNFSMWAAGRHADVPPLQQMPHLLAAGSPEAQFSGFGHEGSGVKLRGWLAMPDRPRVCVQALRVETTGNYDTYYGYFWDHPGQRWKLYAVGRKWNDGKTRKHLSPGSFCEIPGPPHIQRSGDRVREVRRRGWHYDGEGQWHSMDVFRCRSKERANKLWFTTSDGEFVMATGGLRYYAFERPTATSQAALRPEYLSAEATRQLYRLPAEFRSVHTQKISDTGATIDVVMQRAGKGATVAVYYGETDCLTFAPRTLHGTERNSAVSQSTQALGRVWTHRHSGGTLQEGSNPIRLTGLKPRTTYYYRVLVTSDEGRMWSFDTQQFQTR